MKRFIIAAIILGCIGLPMAVGAVGLGISPSRFIQDSLVRGVTVEKEVVLSRSQAGEELQFTVQGEGDIADWVTTDKGDSFIMPAGENRLPLKVAVHVPKDAANGLYQGDIRFISQPSTATNGEGNEVSVSVDALMRVQLTVSGDQIVDFSLNAVEIPDVEQGYPIQLILVLENRGNVGARPDKVVVEIWDKFKQEKITETTVTDFTGITPVPAFETGDFVVPIEHDLEIEQYWAYVSAYYEEELIGESEVIFDIVAAGSLDRSGFLRDVAVNKMLSKIGEGIIISGVFANGGDTHIVANLDVEVWYDGKLIAELESDPVGVRAGEEKELSTTYFPEEGGKYTFIIRGKYNGSETEAVEITTTVKSAMNYVYLVVLGVVAIAAVTLGILILRRKRREDGVVKSVEKKKISRRTWRLILTTILILSGLILFGLAILAFSEAQSPEDAMDHAQQETEEDAGEEQAPSEHVVEPSSLDSDQDGLTDAEELEIFKTDPENNDTDGDGYEDGEDVQGGYNPLGEGKI